MSKRITHIFNHLPSFADWHKHPLAVPVVTFLVLFFVSMISFIFLSGEAIQPNDSKVVKLYVDGETRIVPTRAQTVGDMLKRSGIELREGDVTEPAVDSPIVDQDFNVNVYRAKPVTVTDDKGQKVTTKVIESNPSEMAKQAGVTVYPEDKVAFGAPDEALREGVIGAQVTIERATPAIINLYGNSIPVRTHAQTVGDLLTEKGIKTLEGDTIQPSPDTPVAENTQVFITSFGKQLATAEEVIPAPVEKTSDPNMPVGSSKVTEEGAPGRKIITYEIQLENGREVARRPIQEIIAQQPVKRVVSEGTKVIISNPSENVAIGQRLAAERGWTGEEWLCLYQLWQKESGWNHLSINRSSGAGGIPQSYPASKMAAAGADWQTNPATQIKWGLNYIAGKSNYKTPCGAWRYWQINHSY